MSPAQIIEERIKHWEAMEGKFLTDLGEEKRWAKLHELRYILSEINKSEQPTPLGEE